MNKIEANDAEAQSADIVADNLSQLQSLLPEAFAEGKVQFDTLRQLLGGAVDEADEKYGLNWHGKRRARQIALTPSTGTLRPCPDESVDWDTTQNLMIEGDNLEVLKLFQKSYAGKVKLIYIDPPYNTGKDFVYPDDYRDGIKSYLEITGQTEEGVRVSSNSETSGRYHTDWLSMMYPRLKLARSLLREDGVIVIHMDEHEQVNTETILAEIFGEENILGAAVWDKRNPKGDATRLAYQHESIFFVAKNQVAFAAAGGLTRRKKNAEQMLSKAEQLFSRIGQVGLPAGLKDCAKQYGLAESCTAPHVRRIDLAAVNEEFNTWIKQQDLSGGEAAYSKIDESGNVYRLVSMAWPNKKKAPDDYFIPLKHPITGQDCPVPERGWRNPPDTMRRLLDAGEIIFGSDHTTQPQRKYLLRENMTENFPSVIGYGGSDDALLSKLGIPFDTPKPVEVCRELIATSLQGGDCLVMDFFAGSGSSGHAVMLHNAINRANARFILVQLPEPIDASNKDQLPVIKFCDKLGKPRNISEITKERLRRAGGKIKADYPDSAGDVGFRIFRLDASNIRPWNPNRENISQSLLDHHEHILEGRSEADIVYELLLKLGLDLCVPIESRMVAGKTVGAVGGGVLMLCLAEKISATEVEAVAAGIVSWHKELAPAGDSTVVFRDSAFADDIAKTNMAAILAQNDLENVRSL